MKNFIYSLYWIIHWILIIPASFLSGYAVNLIIALILSGLLGENQSLTIFPLAEIFFFPFSMNLVFMWTANRIIPLEPKPKLKFLIALLIFLFLLNLFSGFFILPNDKLIQFVFPSLKAITETLIATLGSICGLLISLRKMKKSENKINKDNLGQNKKREFIPLHKMWEDYKKTGLKYKIPIMLGVDSLGKNKYADLIDLKNILIGGQTGSGKSGFANCIITSLIQHCSPSDLRILLIDMKRVEFTVYNGFPHLLTDCIVDSELVIKWLRQVIDDKSKNKTNKPYIVIVIDTFSDIMWSNFGKDFINLINEIIISGSDLGISVVMCDSRTGEDTFNPVFISGIKTHICFATANKSGSQLLINSDEGVNLLGSGDMLLLKEGEKSPIRLQAPYISEEEIEKTIASLK